MAKCQSIKNKDLIVNEQLVTNNFDFAIFTETWLPDNLDDIVWCVTSPLQNCGFRILTSNCNSRRGGGLAIVFNEGLEVDLVQEGEPTIFSLCQLEDQVWEPVCFLLLLFTGLHRHLPTQSLMCSL